jgi:hypothetical protein
MAALRNAQGNVLSGRAPEMFPIALLSGTAFGISVQTSHPSRRDKGTKKSGVLIARTAAKNTANSFLVRPSVAGQIDLSEHCKVKSLARKLRFVQPVQSDLRRPVAFAKRFLFTPNPNHPYMPFHPVPEEGRWPSSRTLGWDAVDAAASGAQLFSQGGFSRERSNGVRTNDASTLLLKLGRQHMAGQGLVEAARVRQNRVVLAPVAGAKSAEVLRTQPGFDAP